MRSRDDKRYTEKKNKSERARRKKEDTARLRSIVDTALGVDPRIKRIRQEEKEAREAKKKGKSQVNGQDAKLKAEEEKRKAEEEAKRKEEEEAVRVFLVHVVRARVLTILAGRSRRGQEGEGCCRERREKGQATAARCRGRSLIHSPCHLPLFPRRRRPDSASHVLYTSLSHYLEVPLLLEPLAPPDVAVIRLSSFTILYCVASIALFR